MTKDEMNKKLLQQANSLTSTVDSLNATSNAQTQLIAQLNQTIQELKEQLNKNSKNSPKRGNAGMEQCGVLPEFKGIDENHPEQKWASAFIDLLLEMKKVKDKAVEKGKDFLSYYHYHKFDKKYDELIEQARKENPLPETTEKKRGRKKKGKILALVERLANYKVSVCLFIHNFNLPFDNNQAERDLRMIKVKTKVSGCFRTEEGARDYLKIMSYVGTAHKQGYNAYEAIKNAITGHPDFIFE